MRGEEGRDKVEGRWEESSPPDGVDPMVSLARRTVERFVLTGREETAVLPPGSGPERAGVFVSLHLPDGALRGCLGTIGPTRDSLAEEIVTNAISAARMMVA